MRWPRWSVLVAAAAALTFVAPPAVASAQPARMLYAEDGTHPDGVDVFSVSGSSLTLRQHVTVGMAFATWYGAHQLTVMQYVAGGKPYRCLAFASMFDGNMESFAINSRGLLSTRPVSVITVGNIPGDMAADGNRLIVSNPPFTLSGALDVLTFGAGCAMSFDYANLTGREDDLNIALIDATHVMTADVSSHRILVYTLNRYGILNETASQVGELADPDSIAVWTVGTPAGAVTNVYTGQAVLQQPRAQGYQYVGGNQPLTPLGGSPQLAARVAAINGPDVVVDAADRLLLQANPDSGTISWYRLTPGSPHHPGTVSFGGEIRLPNPRAQVTSMVIAGSALFLSSANGPAVDACLTGPHGVSGCHLAATLNSPFVPRYGSSLALSGVSNLGGVA